MNAVLDVGMWLRAKNPCIMKDGESALIVGKQYRIEQECPKSIWINSEFCNMHEFSLENNSANWQKFFDIVEKGMRVGVPIFVSEVKLDIPNGYEVDIDNSNLSNGLIKYRKAKSKRPMCMEDLGGRIGGWYITHMNNVSGPITPSLQNLKHNHNLWPSKEWAESVQAQCKLVRLRDAWNEGWKLDYKEDVKKYHILLAGNEITIDTWWGIASFLVFEDKKTATEFLETFNDLIKTYFKPYKS